MTKFNPAAPYEGAMHIEDQADADNYFEQLAQYAMSNNAALSREEAEKNLRSNLGYFAGYYSNETRERIERLFKCEHPFFGSIAKNGPPTAEHAFELGKKMGEMLTKTRKDS